MTVEKTTAVARVSTPTVAPLPVTDDSQSVILEPYHVDLLPEYGYASREYLICGETYGEPYCTRLLLRCPDDASRFTGFVVMEPSHLWGGTSIWRHTSRWLMRNGHAWLEVDSQVTSAVGMIKNVDPERYKDIRFLPGPISDEFAANTPFITDATKEALSGAYMDFKAKWWPATVQSPEILTAASHALRSGALGLVAQRVVLSGLSQSGGVIRRFITHSSHLRLPNGSSPFEGFLPCQSGGEALPDVPDAKIIELVGEAEFLSVRFPCGIGGQMLGTAHRRPGSDILRLYEVACMAHRESRWASLAELKRWSVADLRGAEWSTFANSFIYHAVFEAMEKWTRDAGGSCPSPGATVDTIGESDNILRDEHGNAVGGVRTIHSDAPLATFVAATPKGRPNWYWGSQWMFSLEKMRVIYRSVENYRLIAGRGIQNQIQQGFLLPIDAEVLRRETIEAVDF